MYDRALIVEMLQQIERALTLVEEEMSNIHSLDDFLSTPTGMLLLDGVCMNLFAVGETVKNIDRYTHKALLVNYPSIQWQDIMRLRDVIAHHYFEVDAEKVFAILCDDVPPLLVVIKQMKEDLTKSH
ncbi:MAG: DUF86 domain-containing protein [Prevotellaceae bacterium]|jgi:uncharacterized protein with HEPN domain|nr:DUF86 domain-containing protein [Prevotellaceae bacterium]